MGSTNKVFYLHLIQTNAIYENTQAQCQRMQLAVHDLQLKGILYSEDLITLLVATESSIEKVLGQGYVHWAHN